LHIDIFVVLPETNMITIRSANLADAPAIARIHMDSWRTTYRGLVSDEYLASLRLEDRITRWQQRLAQEGMFAYVAELEPGGEVVGFAFAGPSGSDNTDYPGELWSLHVAGPYQGTGFGRRLMSVVAKRLQSIGYNSMMLWVLTENTPARRFYEKAGGLLFGDRIEEFAGGRIAEVAYGWPDIIDLFVEEA
jgi:ribosomal protein S18 acetylase RimI-like enzyme